MGLRFDRLKERRQFKGLSQSELAGRLGVSAQQVTRWESGANDPASDSVARMARTLECTADWLLGLVDQPQGYSTVRELTSDEQRIVDLHRQGKRAELIEWVVAKLVENCGSDQSTAPRERHG